VPGPILQMLASAELQARRSRPSPKERLNWLVCGLGTIRNGVEFQELAATPGRVGSIGVHDYKQSLAIRSEELWLVTVGIQFDPSPSR